jgi:hypothetical protein
MLWLIALAITLLAARYQRVTGPTYPISGHATLAGTAFDWRLERSNAGDGDHRVHVKTGSTITEGTLEYRRAGDAAWTSQPMTATAGEVVGTIPHQPMGTKVAYRVVLRKLDQRLVLPPSGEAVLRFRGDVPAWVLIPHILAMLAAMLYSTRAGLEVLSPRPEFRSLVLRTIAALVVGGLVLGCLVAWYAFRAPWGGFPISNDLTDNKTLLALLVWLGAAVAMRVGRHAKPYVVLASVITLAVYLIPHSAVITK